MSRNLQIQMNLRIEPFPATPPGFVWVLVRVEGPGTCVDVVRSQQVFDSSIDAMLDGQRALRVARAPLSAPLVADFWPN